MTIRNLENIVYSEILQSWENLIFSIHSTGIWLV